MTAQPATRPPWIPEDLFPYESRYVESEGCRVHYIDEGAGPTLLFLHGNPTWSFLFRDVVRMLKPDFRCIALDLPGFGLSEAGDGYRFSPPEHAAVVEGFTEELGLTDITLVAQDWGGPIGLTAATRNPDRFVRLVLGNTWAWPLNGQFHFEAFGRLMGGPVGKLLIHNVNAFVNMMIPLGTATRLDKRVMDAYRGPFAAKGDRTPTYVFPRALLGEKRFLEELERELPRVTHLPTLFVWGAGDVALRASVELRRLQKLFPQHEVSILRGARHFFPEDAPERTSDAIRRWMQSGARD